MAIHAGVRLSLATLPRPLIPRGTLAERVPGAPTDLQVAVVIPRDAPLASGQTDAIPTFPRKRFVAAAGSPLGVAPTSAPTGMAPTFPRKRVITKAVSSTSSAQIASIRLPVRQTPQTRHPTTLGRARKNDAVSALANSAMGTEVLAAKPETAGPVPAAGTSNVAQAAPRAINAAALAAASPRPAGQDPANAKAARAQRTRSPHAPQARAIVVPTLEPIVRRKRASAYRRCSRAPA